MKEYKKLHILKHALEMYVRRPGASELDIKQEKQVLSEVQDRLCLLKEEYGIKK